MTRPTPPRPPATPPPASLAERVEENLFDLFRQMAEALPGGELVEEERVSRHLTFPQNPMFKGVWRTRLAPDQVDDTIEEVTAWFNERNAPFFFWWTGSGTSPGSLGDRLMSHGMISMEEQQKQLAPGIIQSAAGAPCMVADLTRMNESALDQVPTGYTIDVVSDARSLEDFKRVFVESYEIPDWAGQAWVDATTRIGIGRTPWHMYVGRLDGVPVATSMLFSGGGAASVYAVATVPSARGRGMGGAITLRSLLDARATGVRDAVLFATDVGVRAYERIGFHLTDARINRYLWRRAD